MKNKKYLPVWADGLTYDEQHFTHWICNNMERVDDRYSFLPIRILGNFFCERKRFDNYRHFIDDYFEKGRCRMTSQIVPLAYYVAEKAFDLAADEFFKQYPSALDVTFHNLNFNGIYDAKFAIEYETRLKLFQEILDRKIEELCVLDEIFEFRKDKQEHSPWSEYIINARLDIKEDDINYGFPRFLSSHEYPYNPKKQVKVKKEDVYHYYSFVPEKIFILGNQYIKYKQNSIQFPDFFDAAKNRDLDLIKQYIRMGIDINSIDKDGNTAFADYVGNPFNLEKECCNVEDLEELISLGANPAIYGAGTDDEPLSNACLDGYSEIVSLMLENGVNPNLYPCIDEPYECYPETLLERTERWADGDPNIDATPNGTQREILNMLLQYA